MVLPVCMMRTHRYEHFVPEKKPTLVTSPIPLDDNSTVYDYMFDKSKLG